MKIVTNTLKNISQSLSSASEKQVGNSISNLVLLISKKNTLLLRSTDFSTGVEFVLKTEEGEDKEIIIPADVFTNTVNTTQESIIDLNIEENQLKIFSKGSRTTIQSLSEEIPSSPEIEGKEIEIDRNILMEGLRGVSHAAATGITTPDLVGVHIYSKGDKIIFVATDTRRLTERKLPNKTKGEIYTTIPTKSISKIFTFLAATEDEMVKILSKKGIMFIKTGNGIFYTRTIEKDFLNYEQVLPKDQDTKCVIQRKEILNALKKTKYFIENDNKLELTTQENGLKLTIKKDSVGETEEIIESKNNGNNVTVFCNYKYLQDICTAIQGENIEIEMTEPAPQKTKPLLIKDPNDSTWTGIISQIVPID